MRICIGRHFSNDLEFAFSTLKTNDIEYIIDSLRNTLDNFRIVSCYLFDDSNNFYKFKTPKLIEEKISLEQFKTEISSIQALRGNKYTLPIPKKLYHATLVTNIDSINKYGLDADVSNKMWFHDEQTEIGVFLADEEYAAQNWLLTSDLSDNLDEDDVVVYEIDKSSLDLSKIFVDINVSDNLKGMEPICTWFYANVIPASNLKQIYL